MIALMDEIDPLDLKFPPTKNVRACSGREGRLAYRLRFARALGDLETIVIDSDYGLNGV